MFHKEDGSELPKEQLEAENLSSQSDEELSQSEPLLSKDSPQMSLNSIDLSLEGHPSGSWMESQENQCEDGTFVCVRVWVCEYVHVLVVHGVGRPSTYLFVCMRAWVCEYVYVYIGGTSVVLIDQTYAIMYNVYVCMCVLSYVRMYVYVCLCSLHTYVSS